ncbi:hypothetical protein FRB98_008923 [Tulasnella sp. 332]|nr:hypothetical protein FRB98_008923 [Tulasnella sp. 332]
MDLSLLRDSLPSANLAQADRDLLDNFKAAALSITTLYKSARTNSKLNYNVGYAACLHDVLNFVQAGVSAEGRMAALGGNDGSGALGIQLNNGDGMTIGMHRNSVQASSTSASSFTFNVPLPTSTVNPFERDFGSQHLSLSMDQTTDGTTTATGVNENDCPLIMPELPQSLLGTKRRHSTVVSEIPDPSTYGSTTPGGPSSATSRDRNGQANGGGSSKRRNKGNGSASSGASRVLGESQDANAMDVEEGSTTSGEPARKKVARR